MYNAHMVKRIYRWLLVVWFLCFCVFTLKKEAIFSSFFHNVKDIFARQLFQEEKEVVAYDDLVACGSESAAKEKGLYRLEGKDYVMKDGDVVNFRFNV